MRTHTTNAANELFIGIDGGASKTAAVLMDGRGMPRATHYTRGSAIVGIPKPEACAVLIDTVKTLCRDAGCRPGAVRGFGIGLSGIDFADEIPDQEIAVAAALGIPFAKLKLVNDGIVALWAATAAPRAVLLQHGSGLTSAYRRAHGGETLYDMLDVAKISDVRQGLIALVARMIDGRAAPTPLKQATLAHLQIADERMYAEAIYRNQVPHRLLATTPKLVFGAFERGDPAAEWLVQQGIADYVLMIRAMLARLGPGTAEAIFGGGVIQQAGRTFWKRLAERIRDDGLSARVKPPELAPEWGAAIMAAFHAGHDPQALFTHILQQIKRHKKGRRSDR